MITHRWIPLKKGDTVDIVSPASRCTQEELQGAIQFIEDMGLIPRIPEPLFSDDLAFCSNSDNFRFNHLKQALNATDSKIIWCLRGGYGSIRIAPTIAEMIPPKKAKLLIGFSDITTIHHIVNLHWGWASLHGPLLCQLGRHQLNPRDVEEIKEILFGRIEKTTFENLKPLNSWAGKNKTICSRIIGGNLKVIQSLLGTPSYRQPPSSIIFLEDAGERGYAIDRMLVQLTQAGFFQNCTAVIFGNFESGYEPETRNSLWPVALAEFAKAIDIPVFSELPVGHGNRQRSLPFGTRAVLNIDSSRSVISVETGADFTQQ
ncbi:MAG: muramoyltetrapeptide carboxypeptidase [Cellvibrionaceae bacterium]|jgi:muramoyltetrapeptide carboxypeptidase